MRLKQLREENGITQGQLARYLGVEEPVIAKMEKGDLNVTRMEKICNLFGCSEAYLMGEDDAPLDVVFSPNGIQAEDLESIAAVNKIAMNIRYMNGMAGN